MRGRARPGPAPRTFPRHPGPGPGPPATGRGDISRERAPIPGKSPITTHVPREMWTCP